MKRPTDDLWILMHVHKSSYCFIIFFLVLVIHLLKLTASLLAVLLSPPSLVLMLSLGRGWTTEPRLEPSLQTIWRTSAIKRFTEIHVFVSSGKKYQKLLCLALDFKIYFDGSMIAAVPLLTFLLKRLGRRLCTVWHCCWGTITMLHSSLSVSTYCVSHTVSASGQHCTAVWAGAGREGAVAANTYCTVLLN